MTATAPAAPKAAPPAYPYVATCVPNGEPVESGWDLRGLVRFVQELMGPTSGDVIVTVRDKVRVVASPNRVVYLPE